MYGTVPVWYSHLGPLADAGEAEDVTAGSGSSQVLGPK